jgi:CRP-like cAMP-binding protein
MANLLEKLYTHLNEANLWHDRFTIKRGEHLHMEGKTDTNIYYVEEGTLRSYVIVNDEEQCIRFGYAGDFIGAMDSYINHRPTTFNTQALRKCTVRVLRQSDFQGMMVSSPALAELWQSIMSWMIVGQLEREIDLLTNSPEERYLRVLNRGERVFQEIPAKYIANYLRMTPETLSRVRSRLGQG